MSGIDVGLKRLYIIALLRSSGLFAGAVTTIHHLQSNSYYHKLLAGKTTGELDALPALPDAPAGHPAPLALELDFDDGPAGHAMLHDDAPVGPVEVHPQPRVVEDLCQPNPHVLPIP
eukprot:14230167-Alexandrium_andersonii.AAC.1